MEERLNKFISSCGVCSRRKADELIVAGRIAVNGEVIKELGYKVKETDEVMLDNEIIQENIDKKYIMLNKPIGYVTTVKEQFARPCVTDLIKEEGRVFPIGRLDMYSEGLLLLTNDGHFANKVIHPRNHIRKLYEVTLNKEASQNDIDKLINGIDIGGYITKKAEVEMISSKKLEIAIYEGKNRQIRKMCEAIGFKVMSLKRVKIGKLELGKLKPGEYVLLKNEDIQKIFK
ncbi:MAG: rRNA pseudouridine synthase [Clostridia bacterium]|nr:rRNA pseudouridine synthase [Clostridia bacterium]